tara:strand:- start:255 stop:1187 length:933 start_codon:yes stop_codon:yes gene_type:complete
MQTICPICKKRNFFQVISNCKENIRLTEKSYNYGKCFDCKIISLCPTPDIQTISNHYQFLNKEKEKNMSNKKILALLFKIKDYYQNKKNIKNTLRNILKFGEEDFPYIDKLSGKRILDLGAGNGFFSLFAKEKGFNVISIEQNKSSIKFAKSIGVKMIASDINSKISMQYASVVDNVVMNHVFEHILEPYNFLSILRKNISNHTKVVILIPNANSIWRFIFKEKWYGWDPPIHVHLYNKKSLDIIINNAGFKVEYLSSINRIDSFYAALMHAGKKPKYLKFILRLIIFPIQPFLKIFNLTPELLCIISKK